MCLTFHPYPYKVHPASCSDLVLCPRGPEQHKNLDAPPKLFLIVIMKHFVVAVFQL